MMAGLLHTRPNCTTVPALPCVSLHLTDQVWLEVLQYTYPFDQPTECHQETELIDSVLALYMSCLAKADNASFRDWVIVREDTGNLKKFTLASWCSCSFDQWLHACTYSLHALTSSQSIVLLVPDCSSAGLGCLIEAWRHGSSLEVIGIHWQSWYWTTWPLLLIDLLSEATQIVKEQHPLPTVLCSMGRSGTFVPAGLQRMTC